MRTTREKLGRRSWRALASASLAILATACAGTSWHNEGGIAGNGSAMQFRIDDGPGWSFAVRGPDLLLQRGGAVRTLHDVVPDHGVAYQVQDFRLPELEFELRDGRRAHWNGDIVTLDGTELRFEAAPDESVGK